MPVGLKKSKTWKHSWSSKACSACDGRRLRPESLAIKVAGFVHCRTDSALRRRNASGRS